MTKIEKLRSALPHEHVCKKVLKMSDKQCNVFWMIYATISWSMIPFHWIFALSCGSYNLCVKIKVDRREGTI